MRPRLARHFQLAFLLLLAGALGFYEGRGAAAASFRLSSPSFENDKTIPAKYTCEGADVSPPLAWSNVPGGTKSLALIIDDPDAPDPRAPQKTWVHWVVYAIPPGLSALPEDANLAQLGVREGLNDWHTRRYRGACPPVGRHRYFHKLYALDIVLPELDPPDKASLERAMRNHLLGQATLVGTYAKAGARD